VAESNSIHMRIFIDGKSLAIRVGRIKLGDTLIWMIRWWEAKSKLKWKMVIHFGQLYHYPGDGHSNYNLLALSWTFQTFCLLMFLGFFVYTENIYGNNILENFFIFIYSISLKFKDLTKVLVFQSIKIFKNHLILFNEPV